MLLVFVVVPPRPPCILACKGTRLPQDVGTGGSPRHLDHLLFFDVFLVDMPSSVRLCRFKVDKSAATGEGRQQRHGRAAVLRREHVHMLTDMRQ